MKEFCLQNPGIVLIPCLCVLGTVYYTIENICEAFSKKKD
jgi:hypothetical protein